MAISLAALLGVPSLKLRKSGLAETTWHQDIHWVAVTELEDPQRFLNGGELVLTTGHAAEDPPRSSAASSARSSGPARWASASAIGLTHEAVPPALIAEANRWGLPVVEVPYETPFIAIGKLVADAQSADHYAKLERLIAGHQILARALLTGGGLAELLKHLGSMLRTDVVLTQFTAQLYNSAAGSPSPTADGWASYPIPTGRRDACTLWVRQPVRGLGNRRLRAEPDQRRAQQHGQAAAVAAGPGRAGAGGRHPRHPGAHRGHPAARRHRRQQHPQERGAAGGIRGPRQAAGQLLAAAAAGGGGDRRRRQGPGGGGRTTTAAAPAPWPGASATTWPRPASTPRSASAGPTPSRTACAGATSRPATRPATACRSTNRNG